MSFQIIDQFGELVTVDKYDEELGADLAKGYVQLVEVVTPTLAKLGTQMYADYVTEKNKVDTLHRIRSAAAKKGAETKRKARLAMQAKKAKASKKKKIGNQSFAGALMGSSLDNLYAKRSGAARRGWETRRFREAVRKDNDRWWPK